MLVVRVTGSAPVVHVEDDMLDPRVVHL